MLKIFHTADVHLDSSFSLYDSVEAEKRRTGLRSTFCSMIHTARRNQADVFLIAGDLFESSHVTKDTIESVFREIEAFPTCDFFIIPGNHDMYNSGSPYALLPWPKNVHIFTKEQPEYFDIPEKNARIYGHAYNSKSLPQDLFSGFRVEDTSKINILLAHGFVNMPQSDCNVLMKSDIQNSGLDYIALGHVHAHGGFEKEGDTTYAYSGCAVGRGFDECGYKYAILGSISKQDGKPLVNLSLYKSTDRRFETISVDITGVATNNEALDIISRSASEFDEAVSLRVVLEGTVAHEVDIRTEDLRRVLKLPSYIEVEDNTMPLFDTEKLKDDPTVIGAFYRRLEPQLYSGDPQQRKIAALALRYGLSALRGYELNG